MATNRPQGDLVVWRINMKHFQKTIEISSLDKKNLSYSCRPWDSNPQSPSCSVVAFAPRIVHCLNYLATEDQRLKLKERIWMVSATVMKTFLI